MGLRRLVVALVAVASSASGGGETRGLYVAPNATDVVRSSSEQADSIVYYVKESFPATATITFLQDILAKAGWSPLLEGKDLGRFEGSSLRSGWSEPSDDDGPSMRLWSARWRDERRNEVTYTLVYALPSGRHGLQPTYVGVGGLFFTKEQAALTKTLVDAEVARLTKGLREHRKLWLQ
jgi:hypothetical protein